MRWIAIPLLAALSSALGSCSFVFDIRAEMIDGQLTFVPEGSWWTRPGCLFEISVEARGGPAAIPEPDDDARDVERGTYWSQSVGREVCENPFPIRYGQNLKGTPYRFAEGDEAGHVAPKPLKPGVIYFVFALSPGSGSGGGYFRLDGRGGVENIAREAMAPQSVSTPSSL